MEEVYKRIKIHNYHSLTFAGQTLIETLSALAIISIVITAIGISVTAALSNAKYNQFVTLATKYAQQGSERMTQIRDEDYNQFKNYNGTYCFSKNQTTISNPPQGSCTTPNVDNFIRFVVIQQAACAVNVARVTVNVVFTDGKCIAGSYCHQQSVSTCLSTLNPVQVP